MYMNILYKNRWKGKIQKSALDKKCAGIHYVKQFI